MKKLVFIIICVLAVIGVTGYNIHSDKVEVDALLLSNIEALASGESDFTIGCAGRGSLDCPGTTAKFKYVFDGYSLEGLY